MGGIFLTGAVFAVCFGTGFFCFRLTETKREEYLKKMEAELADIVQPSDGTATTAVPYA